MRALHQEIDDYERQCREDESFKYCCGFAFFGFSSEEMAIEVENVFNQSERRFLCCGRKKKRLNFRGFNIKCSPASEPEEILWENLEVPKRTKRKNNIISFLKAFFMLLICFFLILLTNIWQESTTGDFTSIIVTIASSLIILILNQILSEALQYFSEKEFKNA